MQEKIHPTVGILVREDGAVFVPASSNSKAHWTLGTKRNDGYLCVMINRKRYRVHRLIAETFLGEIPEGCQVDHINRIRHDNRLENLRIVTKSENQRNTSAHDRVEAQGRTHKYEDEKQYMRERMSRFYQDKHKTHRRVSFSDGSRRWLPNSEAVLLLAIPLNERIFKE